MVPKKSVNYTDHGHAPQFCHGCKFFEKPDGCRKVTGKIAWNGWCRLWQKKEGKS